MPLVETVAITDAQMMLLMVGRRRKVAVTHGGKAKGASPSLQTPAAYRVECMLGERSYAFDAMRHFDASHRLKNPRRMINYTAETIIHVDYPDS